MAYKQSIPKVKEYYTSTSLYSKYQIWRNDHVNFMTPNEISSKQINNNTFVELSEGTGFENDRIFGVTIIKKKGNSFTTQHDDNRSEMFKSKEDAIKHYNSIK
jgi:hypothetical protein